MADLFWPFDLATVTEWAGTDRGGGVVHMGADFGVPQGTELRATVSGRIVKITDDGLGAYVLDIVRSDGLCVRNAHLSRMDVNTGDQVTAGQVIGLTGGASGTRGAGYSTGAHLHWELRWDRLWQGGSWIDPRTVAVGNFAELDTPTIDEREESVYVKVNLDGGMAYLWNMGSGIFTHIAEIPDYKQIDANFKTFKFSSLAEFENFRARFATTLPAVDPGVLATAIASAVGGVNVNVNALATAIATAIAAKLGAPAAPITKAGILSAIETNYTEAK